VGITRRLARCQHARGALSFNFRSTPARCEWNISASNHLSADHSSFRLAAGRPDLAADEHRCFIRVAPPTRPGPPALAPPVRLFRQPALQRGALLFQLRVVQPALGGELVDDQSVQLVPGHPAAGKAQVNLERRLARSRIRASRSLSMRFVTVTWMRSCQWTRPPGTGQDLQLGSRVRLQLLRYVGQAAPRRRLVHLVRTGSTTLARRDARTISGVAVPSPSSRVSSSSHRIARCLRTCFVIASKSAPAGRTLAPGMNTSELRTLSAPTEIGPTAMHATRRRQPWAQSCERRWPRHSENARRLCQAVARDCSRPSAGVKLNGEQLTLRGAPWMQTKRPASPMAGEPILVRRRVVLLLRERLRLRRAPSGRR